MFTILARSARTTSTIPSSIPKSNRGSLPRSQSPIAHGGRDCRQCRKEKLTRCAEWVDLLLQDYYRSADILPNLDALQSVIKAPLDVKQYSDLSLVQDAAKRLK